MQTKVKGDLPVKTKYHTITIINEDELILFGGQGNSDANILNLNTLVWKKLKNVKFER